MSKDDGLILEKQGRNNGRPRRHQSPRQAIESQNRYFQHQEIEDMANIDWPPNGHDAMK
jgi:hypothetical protein